MGKARAGPFGPLSSQHLPCGGGNSADTGVSGTRRTAPASLLFDAFLRRHAVRPSATPASVATIPMATLPVRLNTAAAGEPVSNCRNDWYINVENVV